MDGIPRLRRSASGTIAFDPPPGEWTTTGRLAQPPWCSRCLDEPDDAAVCVGHRCDQPAATDILDRLVLDGTEGQEALDALVNAVDVPVADWSGHAAALVSDAEPDVVSLIHVGFDTQERAVQRFRACQIIDGMDHGLNA